MMNGTIFIYLGDPALLSACVGNTTEYICLEGVRLYTDYSPCYHKGLECAIVEFMNSIFP